jgi:NAD kinase
MNNILIIKKWKNGEINKKTLELIKWINQHYKKNIYLEDQEFAKRHNLISYKKQNIDLVISLGGDGTILHTNKILKNKYPYIISFSLGTLSFISSHDFEDFKEVLINVFNNNFNTSLRNRINCISTSNKINYNCINEILIHRGCSSHVVKLNLTIDNIFISELIADGIIISSSTGSTAYNLSAGGSLVSPDVEAVIITPICPFSLSFRPLVISNKSLIELEVISGNEVVIEGDGNKLGILKEKNKIILTKSKSPLKLITIEKDLNIWYTNIIKKLNWGK